MSAIVFQLNRFLEKKNEEKLDNYKLRIFELFVDYSDKFQNNRLPNNPNVTEFFDILDKFAMSSDTYEEFGKKIKDFVDRNSKLSNKIEIFFSIFLCVLLCRPQNKPANSHLSYVVAIDNIERLIEEDGNNPIVVQEKDLNDVLRAVKETNDMNILFRKSVIIIFSTRDTTVKLSTTLQQIDRNNESLKISQWFDAQAIYERKFNAYLSKETQKKIKNDILFKAFDTIMNDKRSINGLYHVLSNMYNHNKRRLPLILKDIILTNSNTYIVKEYLEWWDIAISKKGTHHIKYLCRKAILRLFYNRYDLRDLFEKFGVDRKGNHNGGDYITYARKVLTYLYQNNPINNRDEAENYITLQQLVRDVINPANAPGFTGIGKNDLPQLAKMLYLMTDIRMLPHNWSPLVDIISTDNVPFTEVSLLEALNDLENNCREYKIKITDAGRSYAMLNADFEYFACRYYYVCRWPLIYSATTQKNDSNYYCIDIIRNVRENALDCIKKNDIPRWAIFSDRYKSKYVYSDA